MIFAELPLEQAEGAILAYSATGDGLSLRKGTILNAQHIALLREAGLVSVLAARLEANDIGEDEAARQIGSALKSSLLFTGQASTGRMNLFASISGLLNIRKDIIDRINRLDDRISISTLRNGVKVHAEQMVAAIKIIPFAIPDALIREIETILSDMNAVDVIPFNASKVGLIQTTLPTIRESVLNKTAEVLKRQLSGMGSIIGKELRLNHQIQPLKDAIIDLSESSDLILIFGASAVCDEADVLPEAIRQAGGEVLRIGIPVDPGNLLVLGRYQGKYIVGAPGTARGTQETSLEWVLDRLLTGQKLSSEDLAELGVGGLLIEARSA